MADDTTGTSKDGAEPHGRPRSPRPRPSGADTAAQRAAGGEPPA